MSEAGELNLGSELNGNTSTSDQDLAPFSAFRKKLEVIVIRTIQNVIGPVLEPLIQRVVKEQIDLAQERIVASMNQPSGERPNSSSPRRLKLRFGNKLFKPVLTGKRIFAEDGTDLKIELVDENTNLIVNTGPESSVTVKIAFRRVDTKSDEQEGNTSLLNGCPSLNLNGGIGLVAEIYFPSRSKWTKKCECMLIAKLEKSLDGISVMEAKSEVFTLEDSRNKRCEKHKLPTLADEVPRLDNIGKKGPYVKLAPIETLSETQKEDAHKSVVSALEHSGDVVPYNEHPVSIGHFDLFSRDYTLTGHDYTPPRISSPNNIPFGTSCANATLSDIPVDTCDDNCELHDVQQITAPEDITPLNDTFSHPLGGTSDGVYLRPPNLFDMEEFGTLNDFHYESTRSWDDITPSNDITPDHLIQDPNFSIDEYFGPDERLKKDISKAHFREWGKIISVLKFSQRMKMEKPGHVRKKAKFN